MGLNECHMIPKNQEAWWAANSMRQYTTNTDGVSRDVANIALLRVDVHQVLDRHKFAIVPKPCASPSSSSPGSSGSASLTLATHVLETDHEAREFCSLYHNVAITQTGVDRFSPEFLFARFAWAIFAHLQTFLNFTITRSHLAILVRNETHRYSELRQMDGPEWTRYLAVRGQTCCGLKTRKRSSSQVTRDEDDGPEIDDAYWERWARRSRSLNSADSDGDLDQNEAVEVPMLAAQFLESSPSGRSTDQHMTAMLSISEVMNQSCFYPLGCCGKHMTNRVHDIKSSHYL